MKFTFLWTKFVFWFVKDCLYCMVMFVMGLLRYWVLGNCSVFGGFL